LVNLGTAFCPLGHAGPGQDAMRVTIRQADGKMIRQTVKGGQLWIAPVLPGVAAEVSIRLRRGLSLDGKQRIKRRVVAGAAGIIFDARGRPLSLPRVKDRAARLTEWQMAMTGRERRPRTGEQGEMPLPDPLAPQEEAADAALS
jgi:hypothetical protein